MGIAKTLNAIKVPIIAGYIAGFIVAIITSQIGRLSTGDIVPLASAPFDTLIAAMWPVTMFLNPYFEMFSIIIAAIVVGIMTWFALKK